MIKQLDKRNKPFIHLGFRELDSNLSEKPQIIVNSITLFSDHIMTFCCITICHIVRHWFIKKLLWEVSKKKILPGISKQNTELILKVFIKNGLVGHEWSWWKMLRRGPLLSYVPLEWKYGDTLKDLEGIASSLLSLYYSPWAAAISFSPYPHAPRAQNPSPIKHTYTNTCCSAWRSKSRDCSKGLCPQWDISVILVQQQSLRWHNTNLNSNDTHF